MFSHSEDNRYLKDLVLTVHVLDFYQEELYGRTGYGNSNEKEVDKIWTCFHWGGGGSKRKQIVEL